jgi:hypothetical protein
MSALDSRLFHDFGCQETMVAVWLELVSSREESYDDQTDYLGEHK